MGGGLCPRSSTGITSVQYKEMGGRSNAHTPRRQYHLYRAKKWGGGGAMPTRLDDNNTCTAQTYTNPVGVRVKHDIDLWWRAGSATWSPILPLKATTHNSTARSHPAYNTRRKKRACVPIRRNPVRRSSRIGQSSVRRDLAGGSKQSRGPFHRTTT